MRAGPGHGALVSPAQTRRVSGFAPSREFSLGYSLLVFHYSYEALGLCYSFFKILGIRWYNGLISLGVIL